MTWEIPLEPQGVNEWKSIYFFYKFPKGLKKVQTYKRKGFILFYAVAFVIKDFLYKQHNNILSFILSFKRQIECQIECRIERLEWNRTIEHNI